MKKYLLLLGILFIFNVHASVLYINVSSQKSGNGCVNFALFDSESAFKNGSAKVAWYVVKQKVTSKHTKLVVVNMPEGRYASAAFIDENCSGKLDKNWIGAPRDTYGFSNNVTGLFGSRPSFKRASFLLNGHPKVIAMNLS